MPGFTEVTCGDGYTQAATIEGVFPGGNGGWFQIDPNNGDAYCQLQYRSPLTGKTSGLWKLPESPLSAGAYGTLPENCTGIKFRNKVAGINAVVSADIATVEEPSLIISAFGTSVAAPLTEIAYDQITSSVNVTATTEATANTIVAGSSEIYPASRVKVEFWAPRASSPTNGDYLYIVLFRGATALGHARFAAGAVQNNIIIPYLQFWDLPTAGTYTYSAKAFVGSGSGASISAGAGGSGNDLPAFLRTTINS